MKVRIGHTKKPMSAAQKAALAKAIAASAAKRRKNRPDLPSAPRKAAAPEPNKPKPKPHPLETAAGTKPYMLKKKIAEAKPGSVRNQLIAELNKIRKDYWAGNSEMKPPSSTTGSRKPADITREIADLQSERDFKLGIGTTSNARAKNLSSEQKDRIRASYNKRIDALRTERQKLRESSSSTTGSGKSRASSPSLPDPGTMSASAIVKERKELLAKKREGELSKEEAARLVAIQAESSLRGKNRKEGKGGGPTKIALGDKGNSSRDRVPLPPKPKQQTPEKTDYQKQVEQLNGDYAKGKISRSKWLGDLKRLKESSGNNISDPDGEILSSKDVERQRNSVYNVYAKIHNTGRAAKITVGKDGKIEIDFSQTDMAGMTLRPTRIMNELEKAGYRNTRLDGDKILADIRDPGRGDNSGPNVRNPFKKTDAPKATDLKSMSIGESTKKKLASSVQVGDIIRRYDGDREVVAVERKPDGSYRFTTRMNGNPGTGVFNAERNEPLDIIDSATRQNDANSKRLAEEAAKRRASDKPPTQAESDKSLEKRFDANLTALQKIADRLMRRDIFDRDRDPNQPDGIPYGVDPKTWTKKDAIQSAIEGLWYYIQEDREYGDNPEVNKIAKDLWEIEREVRGLTPKDIRTVDDQTLNTYARLGTTPEIRKLAQDEIDRRARMSGRG